MSIIVGYFPGAGTGPLYLGANLARSLKQPLDIVTITERPWSLSSRHAADDELRRYATTHSAQAQHLAEVLLDDIAPTHEIPRTFHARLDRSVSAGLIAATQELDGNFLVIGSAPGPDSSFTLGSTSNRLVHSSAVPVALAPMNYVSTAPIDRVTCAFSGSHDREYVINDAECFANELGAQLRIAVFGVRGATMYPPEVGLSAEDDILDQWTLQMRAELASLTSRLPHTTTYVVGAGHDWPTAIHTVGWEPHELLCVGTSPSGPVTRVFLGSNATRILAAAHVPVVIMPG